MGGAWRKTGLLHLSHQLLCTSTPLLPVRLLSSGAVALPGTGPLTSSPEVTAEHAGAVPSSPEEFTSSRAQALPTTGAAASSLGVIANHVEDGPSSRGAVAPPMTGAVARSPKVIVHHTETVHGSTRAGSGMRSFGSVTALATVPAVKGGAAGCITLPGSCYCLCTSDLAEFGSQHCTWADRLAESG